MHDEPGGAREVAGEDHTDSAARLAGAAASRLRAQGLVALIVPVVCRQEAPEGCGVHVAELSTAGVDLDAVTVLQLLQAPELIEPTCFGFAVALHLEGKPRARVVFAYTCPPEALLVPLTRWVLRSPRGALTVLAAHRAEHNTKPANVLLYPGDVHELCRGGAAPPQDAEVVEIEDAKIAQRLQQVLERLWFTELRSRELQIGTKVGTPGELTRSVMLRHWITIGGRVVCSGFGLAKLEGADAPVDGPPRSTEHLLPLASDWQQLEAQLHDLLVEHCQLQGKAEAGRAPRTGRRGKQLAARQGKSKTGAWARSACLGPAAPFQGAPEEQQQREEPDQAEEEEEQQQQQGQQQQQARHGEHQQLNFGDELEVQTHGGQTEDEPGEGSCSAEGEVASPGLPEAHDEGESEPPPDGNHCTGSDIQAGFMNGQRMGSRRSSEGPWATAAEPPPQDAGQPSKTQSGPLPAKELWTEGASGLKSSSNSCQGGDFNKVGSLSRLRTSPSSGSIGWLSRGKSRSWADLSEEDDEDDVSCFLFQSPYLRDQVTSTLEVSATSVEHQTSWADVGAALEALPGKVSEAISNAIVQATGVEAQIPARQLDVPTNQRCCSSMMGSVETTSGMLAGPAWTPEESELGQWYELQLQHERQICGVVLCGDMEQAAWVEIIKLKTRTSDGRWTDVGGGRLFSACQDSEKEVEVSIEPVTACSVRIYPVVWHWRIALRAGVLEPPSKLILEERATASFRDHAGMATAAMVHSELGEIHNLGRSLSSKEVDSTSIADLVGKLYAVPGQVANAAQQVEAKVVEAWKKIASADMALQSTRQWVDTIPEDLSLVVSARAQAAAMDQVSAALALLEELQQLTASFIAESVLRAKVVAMRSPSETEKLSKGLGKLGAERGGSSVAALEPVLEADTSEDTNEGDKAEDFSDAVEGGGCSKRHEKLREKNPEFWVDVFLQSHAFRIGGSESSWIWEPEGEGRVPANFQYTVYSQARQEALLSGSGRAGEVVRLSGLDKRRAAFVSVAYGDDRVAAPLMPLSFLDHWGVMHTAERVVTVVFARAGIEGWAALAVRDGEPQVMAGGQGWEHECLHRQWSVAKRGMGYSVRHLHGKELGSDHTQIVLTDKGATWEFQAVAGDDSLNVYLVSEKGAVSLAPGGGLVFSTDRALWVEWHVFQQTHYERSLADLVRLPPVQPEPDVGGVFRAAEAWRQARSTAQHWHVAASSPSSRIACTPPA